MINWMISSNKKMRKKHPIRSKFAPLDNERLKCILCDFTCKTTSHVIRLKKHFERCHVDEYRNIDKSQPDPHKKMIETVQENNNFQATQKVISPRLNEDKKTIIIDNLERGCFRLMGEDTTHDIVAKRIKITYE